MRNLEQVKETIEKEQIIYLSSNFTKVGVIIGALAAIATAIIFLPNIFTNPDGFKFNFFLLVILIMVFLGLAFYQLIYAAEAKLKGKKLILKKVIGTTYEIDINQVEKVSTIKSKSTKYTTVTFKGNNGNPEKVLILNSNSILTGREVSAGDIINFAKTI